jgi:hypothetical protein
MLRRALLTASVILLLALPSRAQEQTVYVEVDYMKSLSPDYAQVESEIWKPVHQERIRRGQMLDWALYALRYGDRSEFDYITINVYSDPRHLLEFSLEELVAAAHPGRSAEEVSNTVASRQLVKSELWIQHDVVGPPDIFPPVMGVSLMNVPPDAFDEYFAVERILWKPMHEATLGQSGVEGWGLYELAAPGGTSLPYNFATVNGYSDLEFGVDMADIVARVHPNRTVEEIMNRTLAARDQILTTYWTLVDSTD